MAGKRRPTPDCRFARKGSRGEFLCSPRLTLSAKFFTSIPTGRWDGLLVTDMRGGWVAGFGSTGRHPRLFVGSARGQKRLSAAVRKPTISFIGENPEERQLIVTDGGRRNPLKNHNTTRERKSGKSFGRVFLRESFRGRTASLTPLWGESRLRENGT